MRFITDFIDMRKEKGKEGDEWIEGTVSMPQSCLL